MLFSGPPSLIHRRPWWGTCGRQGRRFWGIVGLVTLLVLLVRSPPAFSQLTDIPEALIDQTTPGMSQVGSLDVADVRLDGELLFQIGAPIATSDSDDKNAISPIEQRLKTVTFRLKRLVNQGFDAATLDVEPAILNGQTIIVVSDADSEPQPLLTVTAEDVEIAAQTSIDAVAHDWSAIIQSALLQAQEQRQFDYQRRQIPYIAGYFAVALVGSMAIARLQKWRQQHYLSLKQQVPAVAGSDADSPPAPESLPRSSSIARLSPQLSLSQQVSLNLLFQPILLAAQVSLWFICITFILSRFPQTRQLTHWLLRLPLGLTVVPIAVAVFKQGVDVMLEAWLRRHATQLKQKDPNSYRVDQWLHTLVTLSNDITRVLAILLTIVLFFYVLNTLYIAIILLGAVAFFGRDILNNYRQTYLILVEDQYLLDDVVSIESTTGIISTGTVESLSLRATQLRNLDGELVTIIHGNIISTTNHSHSWSQVNLQIDVAYSTDLDRAMAIIQQVAKEMCQTSPWQDSILESPNLLGVDAFGDNSVSIRLLIKTLPGQQWNIGREFRRRLKPVFDQAGISIPFPQRSLWFENTLPINQPGETGLPVSPERSLNSSSPISFQEPP
jgi:small-conductance mechanosensitive channel